MMRERLFRGKPLVGGEWVEGCYYRQRQSYGDEVEGHIIITSHEDLSYDQALEYYAVQPDSLDQFTGLYDKNGKKIFEGDIVRFSTRSSTFEPLYVRWYDETASFIVTENNFVRSYPMDRSWAYEVLGNIHDNPELLKI